MKNSSTQKAQRKKDWTLNQGAFHKLLVWLDEGTDVAGQGYLEIRRRLVVYFDRKDCLAPDELADETLNRVARRLEEEGTITNTPPARYCYIVAKFVFLEYLRGTGRSEVSIDERPTPEAQATPSHAEAHDEEENKEKLLDCLDRCSEKLEPENRELIVQYYYGEQREKINNRRALAARLGLTMNALSIRACRIRDKLEACVCKCTAEG